ncbi:hypothetical protein B0T25DRAFT_448394 [Lasiosphaeria hispida]|uniref:Uncharacterized protein n=1 Tax=Lasiosphaeria hispida TaxID=260671 RepID=A0AAJ0HT31_9PEZI|nr:hypothetical protein B0T25DRAFT_448394 [Lasiosphaeria hispida]
MPDRSWAHIDHDALRFCWSVDAQELGGARWMNSIVSGPQLGTVFASFESLERFKSKNSGSSMPPNIYNEPQNEAFLDISNYVDTKNLISNTFKGEVSLEKDLRPSNWNDTGLYSANATGDDQSTKSVYVEKLAELPTPADGWQFLALYPNTTATPQPLPWVNMSQFYSDWLSTTAPNSNTHDTVYELFGLKPRAPGSFVRSVVYYKSMFLFKEDNRTVMLDTPFLNIDKSCSWSTKQSGDACICWKGKPLMEDFRLIDNSNFGCTNGQGYIWGFSRSITLVGVIMEFIWCLVCVRLWASTQRSELLKHHRPTYGTVRSIMDISEVVSRELGDKSCLYPEVQLMKELETCHPVSYAVSDGGGGIGHVGLVAVPEGLTTRRKIYLDKEKCYG